MIEIYKEPEGNILSSYNNSVLEFGTDSGTPARATVTMGTYTFELTPNLGVFYINIKEMVNLLFNQNAFKDSISVIIPANYVFPDATLYQELEVEITVYFNNNVTESLTKTYRYLKAVQQQVQPRFTESDLLRVLLPSEDITRHVTYFEGLPFDVALYSNADRQVTLTHVATGTTLNVNLLKGVNRLFISNGENDNQGFEANMPLYIGVNEVEIYVDTTTTLTLFIHKREADCGVYLKWFNRSGGWSYWRFQKYYEERVKTKELEVLANDFYNLNESQSGTVSMGKENAVELAVSTGFMTEQERRVVAELFTSPKVYYYHNDALQPFSLTDFKEVTVTAGTYTVTDTRLRKSEFRPVIEMPLQYTQTYGS